MFCALSSVAVWGFSSGDSQTHIGQMLSNTCRGRYNGWVNIHVMSRSIRASDKPLVMMLSFVDVLSEAKASDKGYLSCYPLLNYVGCGDKKGSWPIKDTGLYVLRLTRTLTHTHSHSHALTLIRTHSHSLACLRACCMFHLVFFTSIYFSFV